MKHLHIPLKLAQLLAVLAAALILAACGGNSSADPIPSAPPEPTTAAPPTVSDAGSRLPGQPDAPAPPGEFRSDPGTLVGATGNPQLIEFFTYW